MGAAVKPGAVAIRLTGLATRQPHSTPLLPGPWARPVGKWCGATRLLFEKTKTANEVDEHKACGGGDADTVRTHQTLKQSCQPAHTPQNPSQGRAQEGVRGAGGGGGLPGSAR
jgi:hypothetical protein